MSLYYAPISTTVTTNEKIHVIIYKEEIHEHDYCDSCELSFKQICIKECAVCN